MKKNGLLTALLLLAFAGQASAAVIITEVTPWGSGDAPYASDWFELTNTGAAAVDITGWRVDDSSPTFASAVALRGVTSIGPGQSVVFIEGNASGSNDAAKAVDFILDWFGGTAPAGFAVGGYGGSGIGLSTGGDALNLYDDDGGGTLVTTAAVTFGSSTGTPIGRTFDNAGGASGAISTLSAVGINGAFTSGSGDIGSPGRIVPEPATLGLAALAGLAMARFRRKRQ
jgi:hypothetical protein